MDIVTAIAGIQTQLTTDAIFARAVVLWIINASLWAVVIGFSTRTPKQRIWR